MERISPARRLCVNDDTVVLPDLDGTVYVRNNIGSFRMKGRSIEQWVERLLPLLNGTYSLKELTEGLPDAHKDRVYEIASVLYNNGFARDVNEDVPHTLNAVVSERFAAQIAFLENLQGSGAHRFEGFRHAKVLAVATPRTVMSLTAAALDSGLTDVTLYLTDNYGAYQDRLGEMAAAATETDSEVKISFLTSRRDTRQSTEGMRYSPTAAEMTWDRIVQDFDAVLFVSETTDKTELIRLQTVEDTCRERKIVFLPAVFAGLQGFVGPQINEQTTAGSWLAMWNRIHRATDEPDYAPPVQTGAQSASLENAGDSAVGASSAESFGEISPIAVAVLVNVLVFELFKALTHVTDANEAQYRFYRLDATSLEGDWHSYIPRSADSSHARAKRISDLTQLYKNPKPAVDTADLLNYFGELTEETAGIFHVWDEGTLTQLPLSLCRVQPVAAFSEGQVNLLTQKSCAGLTHDDARLEAGFVGLEDYVASAVSQSSYDGEFLGIGTGATTIEALWRALHKSLTDKLRERIVNGRIQKQTGIVPIRFTEIKDEVCDFYLQVLHTLQAEPQAALGESLFGFPVVWLKVGAKAVGAVGIDITSALRMGMQHLLLVHAVDKDVLSSAVDRVVETVSWEWPVGRSVDMELPPGRSVPAEGQLQQAADNIAKYGVELELHDAAVEPFLQDVLPAVYGVILREVEAQ